MISLELIFHSWRADYRESDEETLTPFGLRGRYGELDEGRRKLAARNGRCLDRTV